MNELTQQMLDDYKPYIKPEAWEDFKRSAVVGAFGLGDIVNIIEVYSADGKQLLEKIYQQEWNLGTQSGRKLDAARVGVESL